VRPTAPARRIANLASCDPVLEGLEPKAGRDLAELRAFLFGLPAERQRLDDDELRVAETRLEECPPLLGLCSQKIAREEHRVEGSLEVEPFDSSAHLLRPAHVREHLLRLIDCSDGVAARDELTGDPACAATELEHGRGRRQRFRHQLPLAAVGKERVQLHGAAVGRDSHGDTLTK
jgi:hypothetical protein